MYDPIRRVARWLSLVFAPGTGTHRAGTRPAPQPLTLHHSPISLPPHRSPYGLDLPLDGANTPLVRPYLTVDRHLSDSGLVIA
jgi:hypothetical protein